MVTTAGAPGASPSGRRITTIVVSLALAFGLGIAALFLPVPYVELTPNPPCDTLATCDGARIIQIGGHRTYPTNGHLYLTDVAIIGAPGHPISLETAIKGWFDSAIAVVPRDVIFPPNQSASTTAKQNTQEMVDSQRAAKVAALHALGLLPVDIVVGGFTPNSPARAAGLAARDKIVSVDGTRLRSIAELTRLIARHGVGDTVTVGYRHGSRLRTARIRLVACGTGKGCNGQPDRPLIGVTDLTAVGARALPFKINIGLENVGGPSAGLMFTLGIIDKLTKSSLTGGRAIAGTGTIDADGAVGPIGGMQQKVIGAARAGATVFLSPAGNCGDAKAAHAGGHIRIIKVTSLSDALSALAALRGEHGVIHNC
jgi:PDZ domain-containing protein